MTSPTAIADLAAPAEIEINHIRLRQLRPARPLGCLDVGAKGVRAPAWWRYGRRR